MPFTDKGEHLTEDFQKEKNMTLQVNCQCGAEKTVASFFRTRCITVRVGVMRY